MKITNNNIRAAKRSLYRQYRGSNGVSSSDFDHIERVSTNRTHEKSENAAYDRRSDPTSASP